MYKIFSEPRLVESLCNLVRLARSEELNGSTSAELKAAFDAIQELLTTEDDTHFDARYDLKAAFYSFVEQDPLALFQDEHQRVQFQRRPALFADFIELELLDADKLQQREMLFEHAVMAGTGFYGLTNDVIEKRVRACCWDRSSKLAQEV